MRADTSIRTDIVRTEEELRALAPEWEALYEQSVPRNPGLSFAWTLACRRHLCASAPLFVLTTRREGRLVGVAPLRTEARLGFRVLSFIGRGFTPYVGFLRAADCPEAEHALMEALADLRTEWDLLLLNQLAEPFTGLHQLPVPSALRGGAGPSPWKGASYLALDGDWDALYNLEPRWLKTAARRTRRFERSGGTAERYLGAEVPGIVDELLRIEANSWQGKYGRSQSPRARSRHFAFIGDALAALGPRGEMEVWLARVHGEPAAYGVNLLTPERLWLYRGAYDERFAALGTGVILDYLAIREAWSEGRREYDYMSGGEAYKTERTHAVRPLRQLCLYPNTPRGCLAYASLVGPRLLMECSGPTRALVRFCAQARHSPKALLPWSGAVRSRIH